MNTNSIFLISMINSNDLDENSYDRVIIPAFEMIKAINQNPELQFIVEVYFFAGDTPASQSLGGFVESVGNANYPCRECPIHKDQILAILDDKTIPRRRKEDLIESNVSLFGLNRLTELRNYCFFDPIEMCPQDPMHVILEGVARRVTMDLIKVWIGSKRATLKEINERISNFEYGYLCRKNKTKPLTKFDLTKDNLVTSASEMKTLLMLFPFIFHGIIDTTSPDYK